MELKVLEQNFNICKVKEIKNIDTNNEFLFIGKTDEEISIVCEDKYTPEDYVDISRNWKCIKILGVLDFSLIGVLSKISTILAQHEISVFVVSTYNTDYILVRKEKIEESIQCLKDEGYNFI